MAKNKRATKDGSKGNAKKQNKTAAGKSPNNQQDEAQTRKETNRIRLFPLDAATALEYLSTCAVLLALAIVLGFSVGAGWINMGWEEAWRLQVARGLRLTTTYQLATFQPGKWQEVSVNALQSAA